MSQLNSWNKYPDESSLAYKFFVTYLELGPSRSMLKVCQMYTKPESYVSQLKRWSSKYNWITRASDYDESIGISILENRRKKIEHAQAKLLHNLDSAVDELLEIALMPNAISLDNGEKSLISEKIKAIKIILDKAGLTDLKPEEVQKPSTHTKDYIKSIYDHIKSD